ncbi:MAG: protein-methionine-sulfoxide reductase catalytic subunit MsrP [Anaerolineaceae bacterium]|nr:protein-methionine-sulfoxide reductase catalytic subunit MsrP [Anaerolineaceae bacterium]MBN2676551.1 protein-methionine-sulfoxide reductase catalytic subunit MsrP [Anaerolineaceae bacterium]
MLNHKYDRDIPSAEITRESDYLSRRRFLKNLSIGAAGAAFLAACRSSGVTQPALDATPGSTPAAAYTGGQRDELGRAITSEQSITTFNNYYEFSTNKDGIGELSRNLVTSPWQVEVGGLVHQPRTFDVDELIRLFPPEERIYRMRCVEGWSMIIPWQGFQLSKLIDAVEPMTSARYIHFVALHDPVQMPGQESDYFPWPYEEGLRLDEARNELTLLSTGLYGRPLSPQNGAPIRLVVPWKYGYKSIKAIVKIEFREEQPATFWNTIAPDEYGFYSNVNPAVDHPRWSQNTERIIGQPVRIATLPFNGYGDQVRSLYEGMDLKENH